MSFVDDAYSMQSKMGLHPHMPLVIGLAVLAILIAAALAFTTWSAVSSPGLIVEQEAESSGEQQSESASAQVARIYVHVTGAVASPGMYALDEGARVQDAVAAAGGFTEDAVDSSINLARELSDGEQIIVASQSSAETQGVTAASSTSAGATTSSGIVGGKVNINTATSEELQTLSGIGEATAAKIIAYRQANGSFATIESIKDVSGIGDKKFEAIKDSITV